MTRKTGGDGRVTPVPKVSSSAREAEHEIEIAARLKRRFLPHHLARIPGFEIGAHLSTSGQVGGDFYDFIDLPGARLAVVLGDASGRGIPGALLMARTREMLRAVVEIEVEPTMFIPQLNQLLCRHSRPDQLVTLFCGIVTANADQLCYVSAGHPRALLVHPNSIETLPSTGCPLGVFADAAYDDARTALAADDLLVIYSDGIIEAQDADGRFFDEEGLRRIVRRDRARPTDEIARRVCDAAERFEAKNLDPTDDKTVVVVRVHGRPPRPNRSAL